MDNTLTSKQRAFETHARILANGQILQNTLIEICKDLKSMRDDRLYIQLGYETFEEYAENAVGIKQRQAYSYISTYERLGEKYFEENASLGITKLELISQISSYEREDFVESIDIESVSVRELKEKVEEFKKQNEQLTFQFEELTKSREEEHENNLSKDREINELKSKIDTLTEELNSKSENITPVESISEDEKAAIIKAAKEEQKEKNRKAIEKAENERDSTAAKLIKAQKEIDELKAANSELQKQTDEQQQKLDRAMKEAELNKKDPNIAVLNKLFNEVQNDCNSMINILSEIKDNSPDVASKFSQAIKGVLQSTANQID